MCRSILSLKKTAHQMWCDNPFSLRNMTTERTVEVGVGGDREVNQQKTNPPCHSWLPPFPVKISHSPIIAILERFHSPFMKWEGGSNFENEVSKSEANNIYWAKFEGCSYASCTPSIETHLAVVRRLPIKKFLPKCINEKSSTEHHS